MSASVLFDAPGPATRARHRAYAIVTVAAMLGLVAYAGYRFWVADQFAYDKWEPFFTPRYVIALLQAWGQTLMMAVFAVVGAVIVGFLLGVGKLSNHRGLRWPSWLLVEFFRAVPVIILMSFLFFTVFDSFPIERAAFLTVISALTLYNGAVIAEVVRAGVNALPKGQGEAAYAIGMSKSQVMRIVLLPQAVKIMIPAIISQAVVALKDTSLILIVAGVGLTKFAKQLPLTFNNTVPTVLVVASCYIITNLLLTWLATVAQRRFVGEKKVLQVSNLAAPANQTV